jgi:predicted O-linked N-acetylglucosamine transferase (SPINDLY family)
MGVPTITRTGNTMLARQGESLLVAAGLHDWIARSDDEYVRLAIAHVADLAPLADLRAGLRERVAASALFDAKKFAHELAEAFLAMSLRA